MKNLKHRNFKLTFNKLKLNLIEKGQPKWQQNPHDLLVFDTEENNELFSEVNIKKPQEILWKSPIKVHNLFMDNGSAYQSADIYRMLLKSEPVVNKFNDISLKQDTYTQLFIQDT